MKDRRFLPVVYVNGTYYQVGHDVVWSKIFVWLQLFRVDPKLTRCFCKQKGRTFRGLIEEFVSESEFLNKELLPAYETEEGRKIYDGTVELLNKKFPHYMKELRGIADGSKIPFHKVGFT